MSPACELWFQYVLNNYSKEELVMCIHSYVELAQTSMDRRILDFKDSRLGVIKYLLPLVKEAVVPEYGFSQPIGYSVRKTFDDVWLEGEREAFEATFIEKATLSLLSFLRKKKILVGNHFNKSPVLKNDYEARHLNQLINLSMQHGLFIKNPVILTMEKSIKPQASFSLGPRASCRVTHAGEEINYEYDYTANDYLSMMRTLLLEMFNKYAEEIERIDWHEEYIRALTNNSGGVSYKPTPSERASMSQRMIKVL